MGQWGDRSKAKNLLSLRKIMLVTFPLSNACKRSSIEEREVLSELFLISFSACYPFFASFPPSFRSFHSNLFHDSTQGEVPLLLKVD